MLHCAMGLPATRQTATEERIIRILADRAKHCETCCMVCVCVCVCVCVALHKAKKVDQIVAAIVAKSRIKFYFLQRLLQHKNCERSCCLGMLHLAIFGAICSVTAPLVPKLCLNLNLTDCNLRSLMKLYRYCLLIKADYSAVHLLSLSTYIEYVSVSEFMKRCLD